MKVIDILRLMGCEHSSIEDDNGNCLVFDTADKLMESQGLYLETEAKCIYPEAYGAIFNRHGITIII